ncbi:DUF2953 domain-containing protein [Gorillibacterium timonense]|uniref:DUF2953 domain-containing protein n=1 Tax=Gorillibacterium timonense TaxID=1689269 RepID=UPI00071C78C2|nr:DUF2953 domain-containing protein [Gorillibacterium timonense]
MGWLIALLLLLLFLLLLAAVLTSQIRIEFRFRRVHDDDRLEVDVKALFGFVHYRYEVPSIDYRGILTGFRFFGKEKGIAKPETQADAAVEDLNKQDVEWGKAVFKTFQENFRDYNGWLSDMMANITCTGFRWSSSVGVGSPANTAVLVGAGWGLKSFLLGRLTDKLAFKSRPILLVTPCYNRSSFSTDLEMRLQMRAGALAASGWKLLRRMGGLGHTRQVLMGIRRTLQARPS